MQQKGFCTSCLNKAILIEKNTDPDPHWVSVCIYQTFFLHYCIEYPLVDSAKNFTVYLFVVISLCNLCCLFRKDAKVV